jgi:peptide deformylase
MDTQNQRLQVAELDTNWKQCIFEIFGWKGIAVQHVIHHSLIVN